MNNKNTIYRIRKNLKGKPLSAQTVASFLFVQGKDNVAELSVEAPMSRTTLVFLNRDTAVRYWTTNGWLVAEGDNLFLTHEGLARLRDRVEGRAGAWSVTLDRVDQALDIISKGAGSAYLAGDEVESFSG